MPDAFFHLQPDLVHGLPPGDMPHWGKHHIEPRGHPRPPGTGPKGETCGTCAHRRHISGGSRSYWKCFLFACGWTHSRRTDIRLRDPACQLWQTKGEL